MQEESMIYINMQIKNTFCKRESLFEVLDKFKIQKELDVGACMSSGIPVYKNYKQSLFVKLNTIFRRQYILSETEAFNFYRAEEDFTLEQAQLFMDIIDYASNDVGIEYVPDRLTVASFFRVSAEVWDKLVNSSSYELPERVAYTFKSLDEYIISSATTGVENGVLKTAALKRLEMKTKFGGHAIEYANNDFGNNLIIEDHRKSIKGKLGSGGKYNFIDNKESSTAKITIEETDKK